MSSPSSLRGACFRRAGCNGSGPALLRALAWAGGLFTLATVSARADVRLPNLLSDHMVLQQGPGAPIWGWASPGEEVTVSLGTQSQKARAGTDGKWRVELRDLRSGGPPQTLLVQGQNRLEIQDVLVGEVWLCAGQSNMEFGIFNLAKPADFADDSLRVFHVTKAASLVPLEDTLIVPPELVWDTLSGHWQKTPAAGSWNGFSAVGYYFGQRIRQLTGAPVGLIGAYWGGTPAQAWMSREALEQEPGLSPYARGLQNMTAEQQARFPVLWPNYVAAMRQWSTEVWEPYGRQLRLWEAEAKKAREAGQAEPPKPEPKGQRPANPGNVGTATSLFNGMIYPVAGYAMRGALWYQGEANANNGKEYGALLSTLIQDWRSRWGQGNFPFLYVQVAGYGVPPTDPSRGRWAELRAAQAQAQSLPQVAMATAVDIGDEKDIHPRNKAEVARRLALLAQNRVYGQPTQDSGPVYDGMQVEGARVRVRFRETGAGLVIGPPASPAEAVKAPPAEALTAFEVADAAGQWQAAQAAIEGQTVLVWAPAVAAPVAVRYAWSDFPACSLYNRNGLPAFPFQSISDR